MAIHNLKSIMVIDDNDTDLLIAKIVLEKSGFKGDLITRNSGKSALEYIHSVIENPDKWPNIIFLDINMPVVNGFGFLGEYEKLDKKFTSKVKIAVLTSSDNKSDMEKFSENTSVAEFLPKPISIDNFKIVAEKLSTYFN